MSSWLYLVHSQWNGQTVEICLQILKKIQNEIYYSGMYPQV